MCACVHLHVCIRTAVHKEWLQHGAHKLGSQRSCDPKFIVSRQLCSVSYIAEVATYSTPLHFVFLFDKWKDCQNRKYYVRR